MSFLLWQRQPDVAVGATRRVLRAAEVPVLDDALGLSARLQALVDGAARRIDEARETARAQGHQAGFAQGERAARDAYAERLATLTAEVARREAAFGGQLADLALQVARKLIGELADDTRLVALAQTAARELAPSTNLTLVVHPSQVDAVGRALAELRARAAQPADAPAFDVRGDDDTRPDTCRLDTGLGSVDASLDTQLARIAQAWGLSNTVAVARD